jgi:hypothetical protein
MVGVLDTAGERLEVDSALSWVAELVEEGAAGALQPSPTPSGSIMVSVEAESRPFDTHRWLLLARGAWMRHGEVVIENVLTSGFDLHVRCGHDQVELTYRWRPPARDRVAARVLRSRFHLLARAALIQYPALWWAGTRNRVPLHVSALAAGDSTPLVVASSGVGRSTLVAAEVAAGGVSTGDNLAVGDGTTVWGLVEPLRVAGSEGRRMPHGRNEVALTARAEALVPDAVVVLTRGTDERPSLVECSAEAAARSLITSTYAAGELRRYWSFAATLSAGTGVGAAHPPIANVAAAFAAQLPCYSLVLGAERVSRLSKLLAKREVQEACV